MDSLTLFTMPEPDAEIPPSAGIIPRATVRDMVRRRQTALDSFLEAHRVMSGAATALPSAWLAYQAIGPGKDNAYSRMTEQEDKNFLHSIKIPELAAYMDTARKVVDRRMWATLIEMTDLEKLMDKQAKDQFRQQLIDNPPEATEENIFATVQTFAADAGTIFKRGIANCFTQLDRRFRSHDGWKIGSRIILTYCFDNYGSWCFRSSVRDTLHDIDRVFHVLDGGTTPELYGGIVAEVEKSRQGSGYAPRQSECESDYFKVRGFMNGNAHIWFKRNDLVQKVNKLLGEYYDTPIPEERAPVDDPLSRPKTSLAKNYGFYPTPDQAAETVIEKAMLRHRNEGERLTVLEPSAGTGNLAKRAAANGAVVDCVEYQPELADQLTRSRLYRLVTCGDFLQRKPAPLYDRVIMNPPFDRERDIDHVMHALEFLKPDGILTAIMSAGTEFRETRKSVAFRALMEKMNARWIDLPASSFASVGTYVNTVVLRVFKNGGKQTHYW
jgi:predicted RNA methylase